MFERFPQPKNQSTYERVGKGALMMPSNQSQTDISRNYVLKALRDEKKGTGYYPWFCFAAALGEYRSKNYKAAELHCKESLSNTRETHLHHNGLNNALLSLIYLKTDQKSKANKTRFI